MAPPPHSRDRSPDADGDIARATHDLRGRSPEASELGPSASRPPSRATQRNRSQGGRHSGGDAATQKYHNRAEEEGRWRSEGRWRPDRRNSRGAESRLPVAIKSRSSRDEVHGLRNHRRADEEYALGRRSRSPGHRDYAIKSRIEERRTPSRGSLDRRTGWQAPRCSDQGWARPYAPPAPSQPPPPSPSVYSAVDWDWEIDPAALNRPSPLSPPPIQSPALSVLSNLAVSSRGAAPVASLTLLQKLAAGPAIGKRNRTRSPSERRSRSPKRARLFEMPDVNEQDWLSDVRAHAAELVELEHEQRGKIQVLEAEIEWLRRELAASRWEVYSKDSDVARDVERQRLFVDCEYRSLRRRLEPAAAEDAGELGDEFDSGLDTDAEQRLEKKRRRARERELNPKSSSRGKPPVAQSLDVSANLDSSHPAAQTRFARPGSPPEFGSNEASSAEIKPGVAGAPTSSNNALGLELVGDFVDSAGAAEPALSQEANGTNVGDWDGAMAAAHEDAVAPRDMRFPEERSIEDVLDALPDASFDAPTHEALWQLTNGFLLPMPLGRYGHPYRRGWLWGSLDPRRIFQDCRSGGRLEKDSSEFMQLAKEAASLPFASRSLTQRVVVGWAHRSGVLPLPGFCSEPDVLFECRANPEKVTHAVRRHNTVDRERMKLYTVWDAIDLDCNVLLRMSKPKALPRSQRRSSTYADGPSWPTLVRLALEDAASRRGDHGDVDAYDHGPHPYEGTGEPQDVFLHLRRCGFALGRLLSPSNDATASELGQYIHRLDAFEAQRKLYTEKHKALTASSNRSAAVLDRERQRYLAINIEVMPVLEGRPVVRTSTSLLEARAYFFGKDGNLRYTVKRLSQTNPLSHLDI